MTVCYYFSRYLLRNYLTCKYHKQMEECGNFTIIDCYNNRYIIPSSIGIKILKLVANDIPINIEPYNYTSAKKAAGLFEVNEIKKECKNVDSVKYSDMKKIYNKYY